MCELMKSFRFHSERTQIHPDYYRVQSVLYCSGKTVVVMESEEDYHARVLVKRRAQNALNRKCNQTGMIQRFSYHKDQIMFACHSAEINAGTRHLSAAERKEKYQ